MANEKFIWKQDEIEFVEEEAFNKSATLYNYDETKPFFVCEFNSECLFCDEEDQELAQLLADKIYKSFFEETKDLALIKKVINNCIALCKKLLPENIVLTKQLYCCVKMRLLNVLFLNNKISQQEIKEICGNKT